MRFFELLANFTDCVLYGLLLAVATMAILYFVLQMVSKTCVKTWPFYIAGIVLAPLLLTQDILLVAAWQARELVSAFEIEVAQLVGSYDTASKDLYEVQDIMDQVLEDFPLITYFVNITSVQVDNAQDLASTLSESMLDYLSTYMWKRVGWCAAFIILAVLITLMADKSGNAAANANRSGRRTSAATMRGGRAAGGRSARRHRF